MECQNCGAPMYERISKNGAQSTKVYICSSQTCDTTAYIWSDGQVKWVPDKNKNN